MTFEVLETISDALLEKLEIAEENLKRNTHNSSFYQDDEEVSQAYSGRIKGLKDEIKRTKYAIKEFRKYEWGENRNDVTDKQSLGDAKQ